MELFNAVLFGAFTGFILDFWLGRLGFKKEPARVVIAVVVGVIVGVLTFVGTLHVF